MRAIILIFLLILSPVCYAEPLTLEQVSEACCRIQCGKGWGTGTCISETDTDYLVLTNAHVATLNDVNVEFFRDGYKTVQIPGKVIFRKFIDRTDIDFALIAINKKRFGKYPPRIIPLAPKDVVIAPSMHIVSGGCPSASWVQLWEGRVEKIGDEENSKRIIFLPDPRGGQSGSGLFMNLKGTNGVVSTRLVAVITYRLEDPGKTVMGGALPIKTFFDILKGTHKPTTFPAYYLPLAGNICSRCGRPDNQHALGSNGILYCMHQTESGQWGARIPDGVTVVRWGQTPGQPAPQDRPMPTPMPPPGDKADPYGGKLPDLDGPPLEGETPKTEEVNPLQAEHDKALAKIEELNKLVETITTDIAKLNVDIAKRDETILNLQTKNKILGDEFAALSTKLPTEGEGVQEKVDNLLSEYNILQEKVGKFTLEINTTKQNLQKSEAAQDHLISQVNTTSTTIQNLENQRNVLGGLAGVLSTIGGIIVGVAAWRKTRTGVARMLGEFIERSVVDKIRDRLPTPDPRLPNITQSFLQQCQPSSPQAVQPTPPKTIQPQVHEFYVEPPKPIIGTWGVEPKPEFTSYVPPTDQNTGLGPVPPNYPAQKYTAHEILSAVDQVARTHSGDAVLSVVPQLVRSILEQPKRLKYKE